MKTDNLQDMLREAVKRVALKGECEISFAYTEAGQAVALFDTEDLEAVPQGMRVHLVGLLMYRRPLA